METLRISQHPNRLSVTIIAFFFVASLVDVYREYSSGETFSHLTFELFICLSTCLWSLFLWYQWKNTKTQLHHEIAQKLALNREYLEWKLRNQTILKGIRTSIAEQFKRWGFTAAEEDVAFLLLKGLAFKEIADVRGTSEKTIRHQAQKIYQKSGLQGRTELFAYFFEDLFQEAEGA